MKTEHEMLKEIADEIGYEIWHKAEFSKWHWNIFISDFDIYQLSNWSKQVRIVDVREIIYTQEFMDKYYHYMVRDWDIVVNVDSIHRFNEQLLWRLDNPVQYLHSLIYK